VVLKVLHQQPGVYDVLSSLRAAGASRRVDVYSASHNRYVQVQCERITTENFLLNHSCMLFYMYLHATSSFTYTS